MIPKGNIYNAIRVESLSFYPEKCRINYTDSENDHIGGWLASGTYIPTPVGNNNIDIITSPNEISAVTLKETELLLNNCCEHLQENIVFSYDNQVRSHAWAIVTIYYGAFYAAQAFLYLIGQPVFYISNDALSRINRNARLLAGSGTYSLRLIRNNSINDSTYRIHRGSPRYHETIWFNLMNYLKSMRSTHGSEAEEMTFYDNITSTCLNSIYPNCTWPSNVRNKANYNPGYAYCLIQERPSLKYKKLIEKWNIRTNANDILKNAISQIRHDISSFDKQVELLYSLANTLLILGKTLYDDVAARRRFDARMEQKRKLFCRRINSPQVSKCLLLNNTLF